MDHRQIALAAALFRRDGLHRMQSEGVMAVDALGYHFVRQDHMIIELLRKNRLIHFHTPIVDMEWYKLSNGVFDHCLTTIYWAAFRWFRAQRWVRKWLQQLRETRARRVAVLMAAHGRLGADSPLRQLDPDLLLKIVVA